MITGIVGFGDSWIHGDEIATSSPANDSQQVAFRERWCMLGQLADQLDLTCDNRGISGGSLQSTIWDFARWYQTCERPQDWLVFVGLTQDHRVSWWNGPNRDRRRYGGDYMHNHWVDVDRPGHLWHDFARWHLAMSADDDLHALNYWQAVNLFDGFCHRHSISLLQVNVFPPTSKITVPTLYDPDWNMRDAVTQQDRSVGGLLAPGGHPNVRGAKWLADHFTSVIKSCKLTGCLTS